MSIYDDGFNPPGLLSTRALGTYAKVVALIAVLGVLYFASQAGQEFLKPKALELHLAKDTIKPNETVLLTVKVTNITGQDASEVVLLVKARDDKSISLNPLTSKIIKSLPAKEWRQLDFQVNPVGSISPGGYTLDVSATLNKQSFKDSIVVTVAG